MMSEHGHNKTPSESMSSVEGSLARTSVTQGDKQESKDRNLDCGRRCGESFASYDPVSCLWRTSQFCLGGEREEYSGTWPQSGMMRSGAAFSRPTLVSRTKESVFSLLPTVTVCGNYNQKGASATSGDGLFTVVKRLTGFYPAAEFCEVMMGFPLGWTELEELEMPLSRKSQNSSVEE